MRAAPMATARAHGRLDTITRYTLDVPAGVSERYMRM